MELELLKLYNTMLTIETRGEVQKLWLIVSDL